MKKYKVRVEGITPLLQNMKREMEETAKKRGEEQDNPKACEDKLYRIKNKIVQPSEMIQRALTNVSSQFKLKGAGRKTYKDLVSGNVFIKPEYIEHENQNWEVDKRTVVIPATRGRINRYRPKFNKWALSFEVEVMDDRITPELLKDILDEAGKTVGIGDGRKIGMGRFMVTEFKIAK